MKKIILALVAVVAAMLFTACTKVPFKTQEPLADAGLVYLYVVESEGFNETHRKPSYKVAINGKNTQGSIEIGEYRALHLQPSRIEFSVIRAGIEIQKIALAIEAGKIYYLRVKSFSDDFAKFEVVNVPAHIGSQEIKNMYLAGVLQEEQNKVIEELIEPAKEQPVQQTIVQSAPKASKTDELKKAFELKEQGVLTDAEFEKLKTEILAQ
jgi:hypothetical protein